MLSNLSQFSPQGLGPQFPGFQAAGPGQFNPAAFGQPGPFGGNAAFGHDPGQFGAGQQQPPFGAQTGWFAQNPFASLAIHPYQLQAYQLQGQLLPVLGQVAQQIALQTAMTQQIGIVLHQLAQQLGVHGLQSQQGFGLGGGQQFGLGASGQPFGGFTPQTPGWGGGRPQTIQ
jgi:hypothetical protein